MRCKDSLLSLKLNCNVHAMYVVSHDYSRIFTKFVIIYNTAV